MWDGHSEVQWDELQAKNEELRAKIGWLEVTVDAYQMEIESLKTYIFKSFESILRGINEKLERG